LSQKLALGVGAQVSVTSVKMRKRTPIMTSPTRKHKSKTFQLKKNLNYKTFRSFRGFYQFSNSFGRQFMTGQSHWHYSGFAAHKGFGSLCRYVL